MTPFDRAHTTFCSTLTETVRLYSELFVDSRRFEPTAPALGAPVGVEPGRILRIFLTSEKYYP